MLNESKQYPFYVLLVNNECVGLIAYEDFGDMTVQIKLFAIKSQYQKHGFGSILLNGLISRLKKLKITEIILQAANSAVGFYIKKGFRQINPFYPQMYNLKNF
jgi:ribosomal protein S18 acetylase RimI-like enzyme